MSPRIYDHSIFVGQGLEIVDQIMIRTVAIEDVRNVLKQAIGDLYKVDREIGRYEMNSVQIGLTIAELRIFLEALK